MCSHLKVFQSCMMISSESLAVQWILKKKIVIEDKEKNNFLHSNRGKEHTVCPQVQCLHFLLENLMIKSILFSVSKKID